MAWLRLTRRKGAQRKARKSAGGGASCGWVLLLAAALGLGCAGCQRAADFGEGKKRDEARARNAIERAARSVVTVGTREQGISLGAMEIRSAQELMRRLAQRTPTATGVIVRPDGYIVTTADVISSPEACTVWLPGEREAIPAEVVGRDAGTNLAVLKIDRQGLPVMKWGHPRRLALGDRVFMLAAVEDLGVSALAATVSGLGRNTPDSRRAVEACLQLDGHTSLESLGGAVMDAEGRLEGIIIHVSAQRAAGSTVTMALPSDTVRQVVDELIEKGRILRGYLGVGIQDGDGEMGTILGIGSRAGALVTAILPDGPALDAGFEVGDFITAVNGDPVSDSRELQRAIGRRRPGSEVAVSFRRRGSEKQVKVVLGEAPDWWSVRDLQ